LALRCESFG